MTGEHYNRLLLQTLHRLSPDVFFHPTWVNFVKSDTIFSPRLVEKMATTADQLKSEMKPLDACRLMFVCAVQHIRLGEHSAALDHVHEALALAEYHGIDHVAWWAHWGLSAIHTQTDNLGEAIEHLTELYSLLHNQDEWIMADIVTMIQQSLDSENHPVPEGLGRSDSEDPLRDTALKWLLRWGESPLLIGADDKPPDGNSNINWSTPGITPAPSTKHQETPGFWEVIKELVQRMLRLACMESNYNQHSAPATISKKQYGRPGKTTPGNLPKVFSPAKAPASEPAETHRSAGRKRQTQRNSSHDPDSTLLSPIKEALLSSPGLSQKNHHPGRKSMPSLVIYCLGQFRVYRDDELIRDWPSNKSKSIFKYLIFHRPRPVHKERLMDLFWQESEPDAAQRNLYQAVYSLRQSLRDVNDPDLSQILYQDNCYLINPDIEIWVDSEKFLHHYQKGRAYRRQENMSGAIQEFEKAEILYEGDYLAEDVYDDWPLVEREHLKHIYLDILHELSQHTFEHGQLTMCIVFCQKILAEDNCREDAHRRLMRCYLREGHRNQAMHQYHRCVETLKRELDVSPMPATEALFRKIKR